MQVPSKTLNLSTQPDSLTARTCLECAAQRAENLAVLGVRTVLELCVGPSLKVLETEYKKHGIRVVGNDIDPRWKTYHPSGNWIIGDATKVDSSGFDAVVVAPPLSKGCSGRREDSLPLDKVTPSFYGFLNLPTRVVTYVLPGRTLSLKEDRKQLHRFLSQVEGTQVELVPLKEKKRKVVKYLDVYVVHF